MTTQRAGLVIGLAVCLASLAACGTDDGRSGIPTDEPAAEPAQTSAIESTADTDAPRVEDVPGNAAAAPAVLAWAEDLASETTADVVAKCWTIAPVEATAMYADKARILAALRSPGVDGQFAVIWTGPEKVVSVKRSEIASGYACPRVTNVGDRRGFTDNDATWTVHRYLARSAGTPVNVSDVESAYPLVCDGTAQLWDPYGSGEPIGAPLAHSADPLAGITAFDADGFVVDPIRNDYVAVSAPVTDAAGNELTGSFLLTIGPEGYCIGDAAV